jgi:hypothetical protein
MDTKDICSIDLVTGNRSPKTPDTRRRRPHVPSSIQQCQRTTDNSRRTTNRSLFYQGARLSDLCGDRCSRNRSKPAAPRRWTALYGPPSAPSNGFCNFFEIDYGNHAIPPISPPRREPTIPNHTRIPQRMDVIIARVLRRSSANEARFTGMCQAPYPCQLPLSEARLRSAMLC